MCIIFLPPCSNCLHNSHVFLTADWSKSVLFELPSRPSPERRRQLGSSLSASHREFFDKRDDNKTKVGLLLLLLLLLQAEVKKKKPELSHSRLRRHLEAADGTVPIRWKLNQLFSISSPVPQIIGLAFSLVTTWTGCTWLLHSENRRPLLGPAAVT